MTDRKIEPNIMHTDIQRPYRDRGVGEEEKTAISSIYWLINNKKWRLLLNVASFLGPGFFL